MYQTYILRSQITAIIIQHDVIYYSRAYVMLSPGKFALLAVNRHLCEQDANTSSLGILQLLPKKKNVSQHQPSQAAGSFEAK